MLASVSSTFKAAVPETGLRGAPKDIPVQSYLCKKEMAVWMKKYLTSSDGPTKYNQHLKQASDKDMYCVPEYFSYVPEVVWGAINIYKNLYLTKHRAQNQTLDITMMTITFSSF